MAGVAVDAVHAAAAVQARVRRTVVVVLLAQTAREAGSTPTLELAATLVVAGGAVGARLRRACAQSLHLAPLPAKTLLAQTLERVDAVETRAAVRTRRRRALVDVDGAVGAREAGRACDERERANE